MQCRSHVVTKNTTSVSGEVVYFSSSSRTGGIKLKGIKNHKNELRTSDNNEVATEFAICQAIQKSLK